MKNRATDFFSPDEIRQLSEKSDWPAVRSIVVVWGVIAAALIGVALAPNPLTILLAIVVIGSRQLALAVIMHEAAHKTLARTAAMNDFIGQWLASAPIVQDMFCYRRHHMRHHRHTGTENDPDLGLANSYPVSRSSIRRKFLRDLSGLTGIKTLFGSLMMLGGLAVYDVSGNFSWDAAASQTRWQRAVRFVRGVTPSLAINALFLSALTAAGYGWLYLIWAIAWLTVYQAVLRVRSIAEHAMTDDPDDAMLNSRTTLARWWERALWAPLSVNYHIEHHMLPKVPFYNLPLMHQQLKGKGAYNQRAALSNAYLDVLTAAGSANQ